MVVLSKSIYVLAFIEALIIAFSTIIGYIPISSTLLQVIIAICIFTLITVVILNLKGFYKIRQYSFKDIYFLFEGIFIAILLSGFIAKPILNGFGFVNVLLTTFLIYFGIIATRICFLLYKKFFKPIKNILIVGAGQDGKLIAEEIQSRPELGMKVVGFLDDNMSNIEEEDSTIPILGLTYDSEAVIKDNQVDMVIIAVKSRMDSNILTDLAKGIPLGKKT
jgi:FlaA1/EpsC-like NDP-sugar epimerase